MDTAVFVELCRARAKVEGLSAIRLSASRFAVRSRDYHTPDSYIVTIEGGHPIDCMLAEDFSQCKSFANRLFCTHAGAALNSLHSRARNPKREAARLARPARKREMTKAEREAAIARATRQTIKLVGESIEDARKAFEHGKSIDLSTINAP